MPSDCQNQHEIDDMRVALYDQVKPTTEKQKGQWIVLLWCLAGFGVVAMGTAGVLYQKLNETNRKQDVQLAAITRMDKLMTASLATNQIKISEINHRIDRCEESDTDHEKRLRALELKR